MRGYDPLATVFLTIWLGIAPCHNSGMKHIPRKRFGQHFLTDEGLIADIVRRIAPQPSDRLVEIGPGLGALTQPLLERCGHITVVELDRDLIAYWQQRSGVTVVASDVLKVDFAQIYDGKSGIQAAKNTSALIPLCHNILIDKVEVKTTLEPNGVKVESMAKCSGKTGIEMEALTSVSVALLTIYDMCKAVDKKMEITGVRLVKKEKTDTAQQP